MLQRGLESRSSTSELLCHRDLVAMKLKHLIRWRIFELKRILKVFHPIFLILRQRSTKLTQLVTSQSRKIKVSDSQSSAIFGKQRGISSRVTKYPDRLNYLTNGKYILTHLEDLLHFHYLKIHVPFYL